MDPHNLPDIRDFKVKTDLQIRFNDIDILGHVNNTVYFSFYDTGKAYYLEAINGGNINWRRVETVIANIDCAFVKPVYFGEKIAVLTRCTEIRDKSFRLQQVIVEKESGDIRSVAESVMVAIDPESMKAVAITDALRAHISEFEGKDL